MTNIEIRPPPDFTADLSKMIFASVIFVAIVIALYLTHSNSKSIVENPAQEVILAHE